MNGPRLPKPKSGGGQVLDHAQSVPKIERDDVMAYRTGTDRVVVIQGPVGYKRTYMFPGTSFDTAAVQPTQDEPVEG